MSSDSMLMEFAALSRSLGARFFGNSGKPGFSSVCIDSREVREGALFFALAGASVDGHSFVEAAFEGGAIAAMVDAAKLEQFDLVRAAARMGKDLIVVDNPLKGFQDAARVYLEGFPLLVKIGITGSSGKTTTKEIAAAIIGAEKSVVMNPGNFNSETGLPLAVFAVRAHHEVGVFEMGMNRRGEIAELAEVLKPNIALITNIGVSHIGIIGRKQAIAQEKKNIFSCFSGSELALIPADDEYSGFLAEGVNGRVSFYGADSFAELGAVKSLGLDGSEIVWGGETIHFALPGKHNIADALAAIAIARETGVSHAAIKQGLESVKPLFGRTEILRGRATVIRDCYNANLESLREAVEFCDSVEWPGRKIYVIGEMLELGEYSISAHKQAGELLAVSAAGSIFLFGNETEAARLELETAKGLAKPVFFTNDIKALERALEAEVTDGDLVLLKGSRGCALERLCGIPAFSPVGGV